MNLLSLLKSTWHALLVAVGEFFRWLNRKQEREERDEVERESEEIRRAAAHPSAQSADVLNRFLARGRRGGGGLRERP